MSFKYKWFIVKVALLVFALVIGVVLIVLIGTFDFTSPLSITVNEFDTDWIHIHQRENDYWKAIRAESMTAEQIISYFKWSNRAACEVSHYFGGLVQSWPRQKSANKYTKMMYTGVDGQYPVCLDKAVKPVTQQCIVYSFGINGDWSFDEAMEKYGCEVFAFDPSTNGTDQDHSEHIHFYNLGLGDENYTTETDGWKLMTLDSIYRMLVPRHGETIIDYLKIDIEWQEWEVLKQILKSGMIGKIRQLSVEFHLPNQKESTIDKYFTIEDYRSLVSIVKSIEDHMTRFEARANPWSIHRIGNLNNYFGPICFELSFYQILPMTEA